MHNQTIKSSATLLDAAKLLDNKPKYLLVTDDMEAKIIGVISSLDIVSALTTYNNSQNFSDVKVGEIITKNTIDKGDLLPVIKQLKQNKINNAWIMEDKKIIGGIWLNFIQENTKD